jgi:hypothetical protein
MDSYWLCHLFLFNSFFTQQIWNYSIQWKIIFIWYNNLCKYLVFAIIYNNYYTFFNLYDEKNANQNFFNANKWQTVNFETYKETRFWLILSTDKRYTKELEWLPTGIFTNQYRFA